MRAWIGLGDASLEPWFWYVTCKAHGCKEDTPHQLNREKYPGMVEFLRAKVKENTRDAWFEELRQRDERDSTRPIAPLKHYPDAIFLDTTGLTVEQAVEKILGWGRERS